MVEANGNTEGMRPRVWVAAVVEKQESISQRRKRGVMTITTLQEGGELDTAKKAASVTC